jgi:hypothetical protein
MTGALDAEMRALAVELTDEFGKTVTLRRPGETTFDETTGESTTGSPSTQDVAATPPREYASDQIDGSLIRRGDLRLSVPAKGLTFVPAVFDQVVLDGQTWGIQRVMPKYSGEQAAMYELQVRR